MQVRRHLRLCGSFLSRGASTTSPSRISLSAAVQLAKATGCLESAGSCTTASKAGSVPPLPRRCTDPRCYVSRGSTSTTATPMQHELEELKDEGFEPQQLQRWSNIMETQQRLFKSLHTAEAADVSMSAACLNVAHIEGDVCRVQCGEDLGHRLPPSEMERPPGSGISTRSDLTFQIAAPQRPPSRSDTTLLLWLMTGRSCGLAVHCTLSEAAVHAIWCRSTADGHSSDGGGGTHDVAASAAPPPSIPSSISSSVLADRTSGEATLDEKRRAVKAWTEKMLLHRRFVFNGQLRSRAIFDGRLNATVSVPLLQLPRDGFLASLVPSPSIRQ